MTAWGMVMLRLAVKRTVFASSKERAIECLEVARGPIAGTTVLAKAAGVTQLGVVLLEEACAKGERLVMAIANSRVGIYFIAV